MNLLEIASRVRYDARTKKVAVTDVFRACGCEPSQARRLLGRTLHAFPELAQHVTTVKFPGRGRPARAAALPVLAKVLVLCPSSRAAAPWKLHAADVLCRALGGDEALADEVRAQAGAVSDTSLEDLRACPSPRGWTSLGRMEFSTVASPGPRGGLVYLSGSPEVAFVKVGSSTVGAAALESRYRTYYGRRSWLLSWKSLDRRADERALLRALAHHSAGLELLRPEALPEAVALLDSMLPRSSASAPAGVVAASVDARSLRRLARAFRAGT